MADMYFDEELCARGVVDDVQYIWSTLSWVLYILSDEPTTLVMAKDSHTIQIHDEIQSSTTG